MDKNAGAAKPEGVGLNELEARFGRRGAVTFAERLGGPVVLLSTGAGSCVVALQGAQVLSCVLPGSQSDILWLSPEARLGTGKAIRGGIPVCWPWFGPHPAGAAYPAHGYVRARPWSVAGSAARAGQARLVLTCGTPPPSREMWPHAAFAEIEITLAETLTIALTTENRGRAPFNLTEALHSYFAVGNIADVTVAGFEGVPFIDQLSSGQIDREAQAVRIGGEIDRIYQDAGGPVLVHDPSLRRLITITSKGSRSAVLWNPWIEKSARLGDMGTDEYRRMVCVETANAGLDVVKLEPGARHRLVTEIALTGL